MTVRRRKQIEENRIKTMIKIADLVKEGFSYYEIARMLNVTEHQIRYAVLKSDLYPAVTR